MNAIIPAPPAHDDSQARLDRLADLGLPILVGASRKTFLGRLLADPADRDGRPRPVDQREAAGIALTALLAAGEGRTAVWGIRVHDVRVHLDALRVVGAWQGEGRA